MWKYDYKGQKIGHWFYGYYGYYGYSYYRTQISSNGLTLVRTKDAAYIKCENPTYSIALGEYEDNNKIGLWQQIIESNGILMSKGFYNKNKQIGN